MDLAIGELYKVGSNWEHLVNQQPMLLPQEKLRCLLTWGMFLPPITLESHQAFRLPASLQDGICKIKKCKKYYGRDGLVSLKSKWQDKRKNKWMQESSHVMRLRDLSAKSNLWIPAAFQKKQLEKNIIRQLGQFQHWLDVMILKNCLGMQMLLKYFYKESQIHTQVFTVEMIRCLGVALK